MSTISPAAPIASDSGLRIASAAPGAALVWDRCGAARIDSLNALRVAAFVVVLLDHFEVAGPLAGFGLPVFLLLTGFLGTRSLLADRESHGGLSPRRFWVRRARRILPGLYGYLFAATLLLVAAKIPVNWGHFASTVLHGGNYYEGLRGPQESYLSHTWSLALQEQFVLIWPFVVLLLGRDLRRLGMLTAIAIVAVWALRFGLVLSGTSQSYMYRAFETRIDNLLVGCLLAIVVRRRAWSGLLGWIARHPLLCFGGSAVVLATSGCLQSEIGPAYRDTIGFIVDPIGLACLVVLLATFADRAALRWTKCRSLCWLGTISYGMYLYHPLAISTVLHFSPHRGPLQVVAAFALSTIAGAVSYHLIERPFVASPKRRALRPVVLTTRPSYDAGAFRTSQFAL